MIIRPYRCPLPLVFALRDTPVQQREFLRDFCFLRQQAGVENRLIMVK